MSTWRHSSWERPGEIPTRRLADYNRNSESQRMVFHPGNEPYLGRQSLHAFDDIIVACLKSNDTIAPLTRRTEKSELQWAACQLVPAGISLALSVRELIRQGYLYGALVLMRSLAERATTVSYLRKCPEAVPLWTAGWKHGKRPSLSFMLRARPERR